MELHGVGVVGQVADGHVSAELQIEITSTSGQYERTVVTPVAMSVWE